MPIEDATLIEREYLCDPCVVPFVVHHTDPVSRQAVCAYCGGTPKETGKVRTIEGDFIVCYEHGKEVSRKPRPSWSYKPNENRKSMD